MNVEPTHKKQMGVDGRGDLAMVPDRRIFWDGDLSDTDSKIDKKIVIESIERWKLEFPAMSGDVVVNSSGVSIEPVSIEPVSIGKSWSAGQLLRSRYGIPHADDRGL